MITGIIIGIWAYLWTGPLSGPGEMFSDVKHFLFENLPVWLFKPLIGCAKCNAFWVAAGYCAEIRDFDPVILIIATFTGHILQEKLMPNG